MLKTDLGDLSVVEEIADNLVATHNYETAEVLYLKIMEVSEKNQIDIENYGELNLKLGKVYSELKKFHEAVSYYEEALRYLEGENEKIIAK